MNGPLPMLQPATLDLPARVTAMLNALVQQRNQTADEVVNLCGDLADARKEIEELKSKLAELTPRE